MLDKQKYFEELYEVESKDIPTHSFLSRDFGVKKDCKYFIETGTHLGHGVQYALGRFELCLGCFRALNTGCERKKPIRSGRPAGPRASRKRANS